MKFDLHCHSNASDGKLSPHEVLSRVADAELDLFALTDHDTLKGYSLIKNIEKNVTLVSGIELSTVWAGVAIHIIGLDFDPEHPDILAAIAFLRNAREERAGIIDDRLAKKGMPDTLQGALRYCPDIGQVGRPHFAEYMVEKGYVKSMPEAFDKWLGNGKIGDVKTLWPTLEQTVAGIKGAGGVSVLAHPLRYDLTFSKLRRLVEAFKAAGGEGVEVVGQQAQPEQKRQLIKLIQEEGLAASGGSDFHNPDWAWAQIGKIEPLPDDITPIWSLFKHTQMKKA
jgi:3',5'-nucleoside bisphosphate phosphatase